jgi:hypothetical protein
MKEYCDCCDKQFKIEDLTDQPESGEQGLVCQKCYDRVSDSMSEG